MGKITFIDETLYKIITPNIIIFLLLMLARIESAMTSS